MVDIYGHLAPEGNKAVVERLDDDPTIRNWNGKGASRSRLTTCDNLVISRGVEPLRNRNPHFTKDQNSVTKGRIFCPHGNRVAVGNDATKNDHI